MVGHEVNWQGGISVEQVQSLLNDLCPRQRKGTSWTRDSSQEAPLVSYFNYRQGDSFPEMTLSMGECHTSPDSSVTPSLTGGTLDTMPVRYSTEHQEEANRQGVKCTAMPRKKAGTQG